MFKRIIYDNWTSIIPLISFWLTFSVFLMITLRACLMKKNQVRYMEQMPLDDASNEPAEEDKE
ncbi:MAG: hypothetical protein AAF546_08925 [Verrucomicrobiota bacterium]